MSTKTNFIAKIRDGIGYAIPDEEIIAFDAEIDEICALFAENTDTFPDALVSCFVTKIKNTDEIPKLESALPLLQKELEESIAQYNASAKIPWHLSYGIASEEGNTIKKREDKIKKIQNNIIQKKQNIADSDVTRLGYLGGLNHFNTDILPLIQQLNKPEAEINDIQTKIIEHYLFIQNPKKRNSHKEEHRKQLDELQSSLAEEIIQQNNEAIKTEFDKAYAEAIHKIELFYGADYREIESDPDNKNTELLNSLLKDLENSIQAEERQKYLHLPVDKIKKQQALMSISVFMELRQTNSEMTQSFGLPMKFESLNNDKKLQFIKFLSEKLCDPSKKGKNPAQLVNEFKEELTKELSEHSRVLDLDLDPKKILKGNLEAEPIVLPPLNMPDMIRPAQEIAQDAAPFVAGYVIAPLAGAVGGPIIWAGIIWNSVKNLVFNKVARGTVEAVNKEVKNVADRAQERINDTKDRALKAVGEVADKAPRLILEKLPFAGLINDLSDLLNTTRNYVKYLFSDEDTHTWPDILVKWGLAAINLTIGLALVLVPVFLIATYLIFPLFAHSLLSLTLNTIVIAGSITGMFIAGKTAISSLDKNKFSIKAKIRQAFAYFSSPENFKLEAQALLKYDQGHLKALQKLFRQEILDSQNRLEGIESKFSADLKARLSIWEKAKPEERGAKPSYEDYPEYKTELTVNKNLRECWNKVRTGELADLKDIQGYLSAIYRAWSPEIETTVKSEKNYIQDDVLAITLKNAVDNCDKLSQSIEDANPGLVRGLANAISPYRQHRSSTAPTLLHLLNLDPKAQAACHEIKTLSKIAEGVSALPRVRQD
jgi:hypothetical protein